MEAYIRHSGHIGNVEFYEGVVRVRSMTAKQVMKAAGLAWQALKEHRNDMKIDKEEDAEVVATQGGWLEVIVHGSWADTNQG